MNINHQRKTIWTIGHSTHPIDKFINILQSFPIELIADVRRFPGSKRLPQFNKEMLSASLADNNIRYMHLVELGGRRNPSPHSRNTGWRHKAFRGYADYMETGDFHQGIQELEKQALQYKTAYMCSESLWWRCHRALISDYLKVHGWQVIHISGENKSKEHSFTAPAFVENGELRYGHKI